MRIAFDLDNTLIRDQYPFPLEPQHWLVKLLRFEQLRIHTIQLMQLLQKQEHKIWIYTSSMRNLVYLRLLFRWHGIILDGIINRSQSQKKL